MPWTPMASPTSASEWWSVPCDEVAVERVYSATVPRMAPCILMQVDLDTPSIPSYPLLSYSWLISPATCRPSDGIPRARAAEAGLRGDWRRGEPCFSG